MLSTAKNYLSLVKFSHTIFALPFAILGFVMGLQSVDTQFDWTTFGLVILCMIFARSAAMAFNRYIDRDIDKKNPRTSIREIPAGVISPNSALVFVIFNSVAFVITTYFINLLCFYLSPVALLIILGYSLTKRFTWLCHFVLGLGLSLAPVGAYIAVTSSFDWLPVIYGLAVLFWVSGFDIIYALQDENFDRENQLHSIPTFLGVNKGLKLSSFLHLIVALLIISAGYFMTFEWTSISYLHWIAVLIFIGLLYFQHTLVKPNDLSKVNIAFLTTNGYASLAFCSLVILDFYI